MRNWLHHVLSILILLIKSLNGQEHEDDSDVHIDRPRDCTDHLLNGHYENGIYPIFIKSKLVNVYCDMITDGGGWTVIQRRGKFTPLEKFNRGWSDYKNGFGNLKRDFWLGNDNIHILSNQVPVEIRFDLEDSSKRHRFAVYKNFYIDDEKGKYTLHISGYRGDAGDGMKFHDGREFSAKDRGNYRGVIALKGAWWIFEWPYVHLNGLYEPGIDDFQAVHWYKWLENEGLAFVEIKMRQH